MRRDIFVRIKAVAHCRTHNGIEGKVVLNEAAVLINALLNSDKHFICLNECCIYANYAVQSTIIKIQSFECTNKVFIVLFAALPLSSNLHFSRNTEKSREEKNKRFSWFGQSKQN